MNLCFIGTSHAAQHLSAAAKCKGFSLSDIGSADVVFVSEDTPTDENGVRDLDAIRGLIPDTNKPLVLTSAVPPGFTRSLGLPQIIHQAETLRIRDAGHRALYPEQLIVGTMTGLETLPDAYMAYLSAFGAPVMRMTWEDAEFCKIAINTFLISQVQTTNTLASIAAKCGANWDVVKESLRLDARIGSKAYLEPGNWRASRHLLRDYVTINELR